MRVTIPIHLRWGDLDAYGHVNNVTLLKLFEEARIRTFWADPAASTVRDTAVLESGPGATSLTLIARQEIEYLQPMPYSQEPIRVQLWLSRFGGSSIEVCYEALAPEGDDTVYARGATVIVFVDAATGRPRKITDTERAAWAPYLDEPLQFRRSGAS